MNSNLKNEIQSIISGKGEVRFGAAIQTITSYLRNCQKTSSKTEDSKQVRSQEKEDLTEYIEQNSLWIQNLNFEFYISEGAEQRVYLKDSEFVQKLNDGIYYNSWIDYFYNLLLHNFFFPDTAYELKGFVNQNNIIYAVVEQAFVKITQETNLAQVKSFLESNGFVNIRRNDYYNSDLGIILEDLHDENVLIQNDLLFFIDTVFYLSEQFWIDTKL